MAAQGIGSTMLDSKATDFDHEEWVEILSVLPPHEGKSVLEIGPDIGPFTTELAKKAAHVLALNVISNIATNKNGSVNNEHEKNVKFMNVDVNSCDLNVSPNSIDLIYSNLLLIHLVDEEAVDMAQKMLKWLKPGGYILFRESCFPPSIEEHKGGNSSREPSFYMKVFKECHVQDESGSTYELSLVCGKCIGFHGRNENRGNQICWLWEKAQSEVDKGFQGFLDNSQYKYTGILRYERIFGPGFVSTGGIETTREFVSKLDLKPGEKVLDVGCGIGGGDFYMAERYGVEVVGIDLSINMVSLALERSVGLQFPVEFEVADCTKKIYPDNTFHVIYSRDTILHIQDKPALFRSFYKWLKPGGQLLITDYCKKAGEPSPEFAEYIKQRGYDLHDVQAYGQMLRDAGFDEVIAEDMTDQFIQVLERELELVEKDKDKFINDFSEKDYNDIVDGWKAKMVRTASAGEQRWGLFIAKKT